MCEVAWSLIRKFGRNTLFKKITMDFSMPYWCLFREKPSVSKTGWISQILPCSNNPGLPWALSGLWYTGKAQVQVWTDALPRCFSSCCVCLRSAWPRNSVLRNYGFFFYEFSQLVLGVKWTFSFLSIVQQNLSRLKCIWLEEFFYYGCFLMLHHIFLPQALCHRGRFKW